MKELLLMGILFFCSFVSFGQVNTFESKVDSANEELDLQKQLVAIDLENRIKDIPYAVVRVFARARLAEWLWSDGSDRTGRAEEIAVAAIEDHFNNSGEIPRIYSSLPRLFVLLDIHADDRAKQLREKYTLSPQDESRKILALLGQKDGHRLAVDAAVRLLLTSNDPPPRSRISFNAT